MPLARGEKKVVYPCPRCGYQKQAKEDACLGRCAKQDMNSKCWQCGKVIAFQSNYCKECHDKWDAQCRTWQPKAKTWQPKAAAATTTGDS